jgi:hypothetical protein
MMEAARISEMLVNFYQTRRYYNPEDSHHYVYYMTFEGLTAVEMSMLVSWALTPWQIPTFRRNILLLSSGLK